MKVQKAFSTVSFHAHVYTILNKNICFTATALRLSARLGINSLRNAGFY